MNDFNAFRKKNKMLILINTNVDNLDIAKKIAYQLVSKKMAACVNITPKVLSIYHWQGEVQEQEEYTLSIKATTDKFEEIERIIKSLHTYELPEIIGIDISKCSIDYFNWIHNCIHQHIPEEK